MLAPCAPTKLYDSHSCVITVERMCWLLRGEGAELSLSSSPLFFSVSVALFSFALFALAARTAV